MRLLHVESRVSGACPFLDGGACMHRGGRPSLSNVTNPRLVTIGGVCWHLRRLRTKTRQQFDIGSALVTT